jgi:hypothetical protein
MAPFIEGGAYVGSAYLPAGRNADATYIGFHTYSKREPEK